MARVTEVRGLERPFGHLVVCDDDPLMHQMVAHAMGEAFTIKFAASGRELVARLAASPKAVVLLDLCLAGREDGLSTLVTLRARFPRAAVVVWSGREDYASIVQAMQRGAVDYVPKGAGLGPLERALKKWADVGRVEREPLRSPPPFPQLSDTWRACTRRLRQFELAQGHILLTGEPGCGKTFLARHIGFGEGPRIEIARGMWVPPSADVAAAAPLGESTAARIEESWHRAEGGGLIVEAVDELDFRAQSRLTALLDRQLATEESAGVDPARHVRVVATARRSGGSPLFERLCVLVLAVPSLRERPEDIAPLAEHFVGQLRPERLPLSAEFTDFLRQQLWPGNVRQLANAMQYGLAVAGDGPMRPACLDTLAPGVDTAGPAVPSPAPSTPARPRRAAREASRDDGPPTDDENATFRVRMRAAEKMLLGEEYRRANYSITEMATRIGMSRTYLYEKLRKAGVLRGQARARR